MNKVTGNAILDWLLNVKPSIDNIGFEIVFLLPFLRLEKRVQGQRRDDRQTDLDVNFSTRDKGSREPSSSFLITRLTCSPRDCKVKAIRAR